MKYALRIIVIGVLAGLEFTAVINGEESVHFESLTPSDYVPVSIPKDGGLRISDSARKGNIVVHGAYGPYIRVFDPVTKAIVSEYTAEKKPNINAYTSIYSMVSLGAGLHVIAPTPYYGRDNIKLILTDENFRNVYIHRGDTKRRIWDLAYLSENRFMVNEGTSWTELRKNGYQYTVNIQTMSVVNKKLIIESEVEIEIGYISYDVPFSFTVSENGEVVYLQSEYSLYKIVLETKQYTKSSMRQYVPEQYTPRGHMMWKISSIDRVGDSLLMGDNWGYIHRFSEDIEYLQTLPNVKEDVVKSKNTVESATERDGKLYVTTWRNEIIIFSGNSTA